MLALQRMKATLSDVNPRAEKHGEETKMAADLKLEMNVSNDLLAEFAPTLKWSFYHKAESAQAELVEDKTHMPNLRYPLIGKVPFALEIIGATVTVHHGLGGKSDLILGECKVNNFSFDMQEGGTVAIGCRVQAHPDAKQMGILCEKIQTPIEFTLEPPEAATA